MLNPVKFCVAGIVVALFSGSALANDFARARKAAGGTFDVFIADARIVDGTGRPAYQADLLVKGDAIVFIGDAPDDRVKARRVIRANGRVLSPGFIDSHAHGNAETDDFDAYLAMGVTTVVLGQDGWSASIDQAGAPTALAPWIARIKAKGLKINVAPLSGHGTLRHLAGIPDTAHAINAEQQAQLNARLADDLRAGSLGLSTGLEYVPGRYAEAAELVPLARLVEAADGIVISHMRTEDDGLIEGAIEELVSYGGNARIQASHLKIVFAKDVASADRVLDLVARKRAQGVRLSADAYPYTAGYTWLGVIFPEWALPPADYPSVLNARRDELRDYVRARMIRRGGPESLLFGSEPHKGKTLADVAAAQGKPFEEVLLELGPAGGHGAHFIMDEKVQDRLVTSPLTAISSDGGPGIRHPRSTGTYARLIEHYVVNGGKLTLEEAVRKASGLPAASMGLTDRGIVKAGAKADLLLFDPTRVRARSTYLNPFEPAIGFDMVMLNGTVVREGDATSTINNGVVVTRPTGKSKR